MTMRKFNRLVATVCLLLAGGFGEGNAQVCDIPDAVRAMIPADPPAGDGYRPLEVTGTGPEATPLGVGHVRYSSQNPVSDRPPGEDNWLRRVELALSEAPGEAASIWLAGGWILRSGAAPIPLSTRGMIETGYEELSFIVLEVRPGGWMRIRYSAGAGDSGTAWMPSCALRENAVLLDLAEWSDWFLSEFLSGAISPLFFRSQVPGALHSGPSQDAMRLPAIQRDYILEPIEIRGEWMRVTVKEPSDYCEFDLELASREGWIRWHSADQGPLVWYFTRGC